MNLILASKSVSRQAMLTAAGVPFTTVPADIDERVLEADMLDAEAEEIAQALSAAKAVAVSQNHNDSLVLGSDSLVTVHGRRFDKPQSREQAAEHLRFFSGKAMQLHSAAALAKNGQIVWLDHAMASLHVRELPDEFIETYLDAEWPAVSHCVGVFRIEGRGVQLFDRIIGEHFTVLGMPLLAVLGALRKFKVLEE